MVKLPQLGEIYTDPVTLKILNLLDFAAYISQHKLHIKKSFDWNSGH